MSAQPDDIHRHSGWLIPLVFLGLVAALSGLFLLYYLRPGPQTGGEPTDDARIVALSVQGLALKVPANYIKSPAARAGGAMTSLSLVALLPAMRGYSDADRRLFATNAPDSPVLYLLLHAMPGGLAPEAQLARIYAPYVASSGPGPFGLTRYVFKPGNGYGRSELYAGSLGKELVLLICERPMPDLPSPNCIATDRPLRSGLGLSYRFKRAYLSRWREIASGINGLLARFEDLHQP